jgi:hypothetical protein
MSVAPPGLSPLIARTPGCASLARGYSLSAPPGLGGQHKSNACLQSPQILDQRWNSRAFSCLTARGGGLP